MSDADKLDRHTADMVKWYLTEKKVLEDRILELDGKIESLVGKNNKIGGNDDIFDESF